MLIRTHLLITSFLILVFINFVNNTVLFFSVALISTLIPDIDSKHSKTGNHLFLRPLQFFLSHRGILHSFTFLFLITLGFILFFPVFAFPFFLGYCSHLIADSFTVKGIRPFYPYSWSCSGGIKTGGVSELIVFFLITFALLFLVFFKFF